MTPDRDSTSQRRAARVRMTALLSAAVVAGMVGMAYAAVPLYRIFCQVTGYGGTTQTADIAPDEVGDRQIVVRFDGNVANGLVWKFRPEQRSMKVHVGETALAFFKAVNVTGKSVTGHATYNVTPLEAGPYFVKIECFCFTEQTLGPGQSADMPVEFFIDPSIEDDPGLDYIGTITLSYTFFPSEAAEVDPGA